MNPYYQDEFVTLCNGDAYTLAADILEPKESVLVSDPPYGIKYAGYNHGTVLGDDSDQAARWVCELAGEMPAVLFGANHYAVHLPTVGAWSCWDKRCSAAADRMFGAPFELIWASGDDRSGKMYRIQHGGVVNADGGNVKRVHPTQKPVAVMAHVLADWTTPERVVVDPFAGSGSTLVAAKRAGRKAIGIELSERYCAITAERLAQGVLDFGGA